MTTITNLKNDKSGEFATPLRSQISSSPARALVRSAGINFPVDSAEGVRAILVEKLETPIAYPPIGSRPPPPVLRRDG
jgi:hypothetical protein